MTNHLYLDFAHFMWVIRSIVPEVLLAPTLDIDLWFKMYCTVSCSVYGNNLINALILFAVYLNLIMNHVGFTWP